MLLKSSYIINLYSKTLDMWFYLLIGPYVILFSFFFLWLAMCISHTKIDGLDLRSEQNSYWIKAPSSLFDCFPKDTGNMILLRHVG